MYIVLKDAKKTHLMAFFCVFLTFCVCFFPFRWLDDNPIQIYVFFSFFVCFFPFCFFQLTLRQNFGQQMSFFRKRHFLDLWHRVPLLCQRSLFFGHFCTPKIKKRPHSVEYNWRKVGFSSVFLLFIGANCFLSSFFRITKWLFSSNPPS